MKYKLFAIAFLILTILSILPQNIASSQSTIILRVEKDNIFTYKQPNYSSPKLFSLQKSYFLSAQSFDENFYQLSYGGEMQDYLPIVCYVRKEDVKIFVDQIPQTIYPNIDATCKTDAFLYSNADTTSPINAVLLKDQSIKIYGFLSQSGQQFAYAKCGNFIGYTLTESLDIQQILPHQIPLSPTANPLSDFEQTPSNQLSKTVQILLIIAILLPTVIIIFVSYGKSKQ